MATVYDHITANRVKTWVIMGLFSLFVFVVLTVFASAMGLTSESGIGFLGIGFIIIGIINFFSYYYSDKMVLGISGAKPIAKKDAPELYRVVENICIASGQPMPKVYLMNETAPNAFATGRDPKHAAVAVTRGLLEYLDRDELEGVIGHELSHIKNYDTRLMSIVAILVGTVALLADWFMRMQFFGGSRDRERGGSLILIVAMIMAVLAPIVGMLIQLAISRRREFLADASSALLTRNPNSLADALTKIDKNTTPLRSVSTATAHLFIANPFKERGMTSAIAKFFSTHPPVSERVALLRAM
ncbi:MAG: M48 family metallopeptidase [bacterium]|nr:M48 family metallopeptidase [bacterium]